MVRILHMGCYTFSSVVHFTISSQRPPFCQLWSGGKGYIVMVPGSFSLQQCCYARHYQKWETKKETDFVAENLKRIRQGWQEDRQARAMRYDETAWRSNVREPGNLFQTFLMCFVEHNFSSFAHKKRLHMNLFRILHASSSGEISFCLLMKS